jgi:hypothetical protein
MAPKALHELTRGNMVHFADKAAGAIIVCLLKALQLDAQKLALIIH